MRLGELIQVTAADTYLVRLTDESSGFIGQFVSISTADAAIIGVITGITHSVRGDMLGYLSQDNKIKYQPYIEDYKNSYCIIHGIGRLSSDGGDGDIYTIDKPPHIDDPVKPASSGEIVRFHTVHGKTAAAYLHDLQDQLQLPVILSMIEQLERVIPESADMLQLVRRYMKRTT